MSAGFEWPAPGAPTCGEVAEERSTGERFACLLRRGHRELNHYWQEIRGDQLRSASWIADSRVTMIGLDPRVAAEDRAATVHLYGEAKVAELEREANRQYKPCPGSGIDDLCAQAHGFDPDEDGCGLCR